MAYFVGYDNPHPFSPNHHLIDDDTRGFDFAPDVMDPERVARMRYPISHIRDSFVFLEQGRPVLFGDFAPKMIWEDKRYEPLDNNSVNFVLISDRVKQIIEEIEPDTHQFVPLPVFRPKAKEPFAQHYVLNICNSIAAVDEEHTTWEFEGDREAGWGLYSGGPDEGLVFNSSKIGAAKLWRDQNILRRWAVCSDDLGQALKDADLVGVGLHHFEEV